MILCLFTIGLFIFISYASVVDVQNQAQVQQVANEDFVFVNCYMFSEI